VKKFRLLSTTQVFSKCVGNYEVLSAKNKRVYVSEKHSVHSHMYADDTQLYDSSSLVDAESVRDRLTSDFLV